MNDILQDKVEDELSFETIIKNMSQIVEKLESGKLSLEESLRLYEEGIHLSRLGNKKLEIAEKKIQMLQSSSESDQENSYTLTDFSGSGVSHNKDK